jgi:hypothetical protein
MCAPLRLPNDNCLRGELAAEYYIDPEDLHNGGTLELHRSEASIGSSIWLSEFARPGVDCAKRTVRKPGRKQTAAAQLSSEQVAFAVWGT